MLNFINMETIIITSKEDLREIVKQVVTEVINLHNQFNDSELPDEINVTEAAQLLKISVATVYQMTHRREIPFYKIPGGKKLIFKRKELVNFLQSGRSCSIKEIEEAINSKSNKA